MKIMIEDHDDYDKARIMLDLLFHKDNKNQTNLPTNGDNEPATSKQIYFLEKNEIPHQSDITKKHASELIDHYIKNNGGAP